MSGHYSILMAAVFLTPTDAAGYLQLGKGMHLHSKADTAIIDGVVLLEL
jgi:hypothetical protein